MSKRNPIIEKGRIRISTPEEQIAESEKSYKSLNARTAALNRKLLGKKLRADDTYNPGEDMLRPPARQGASQHELIPSRMNGRLIYRDGRVVEISNTTKS